jgi:hypothetical protein
MPLDREVRPTHCVNALMYSVESPSCNAILDGSLAEPESQELQEGDYPVLPGCDCHDEPIDLPACSTMVGFPHHGCGFPSIVGHRTMLAAQTSRVAGRLCRDSDRAVTRALRSGPAAYPGARHVLAQAQRAKPFRCGSGADGAPMTLSLLVSTIRSDDLS